MRFSGQRTRPRVLRWAPRPTLVDEPGGLRRGAENGTRGRVRSPEYLCSTHRIYSHHLKKRNAANVAMIDAIAVANAEVHADFK